MSIVNFESNVNDLCEYLKNKANYEDVSVMNFYNLVKEMKEEIEQQNKEIILLQRIYKKEMFAVNRVQLHCISAIYGINDILNTEKITHFNKEGRCTNRNRYQIERLKAYRTKCKEMLKLIENESEVK